MCVGIILFFLVAPSVCAQTVDTDGAADSLLKEGGFQRGPSGLDSFPTTFYQRTDSLKFNIQNRLAKLDSAKAQLKSKLDSLTTLHLSTTRVANALDSVNQLSENLATGLNKKLQSLKDQAKGKIKELELPPELNEKVSAITGNIEGFNISGSDLNLPALKGGNTPVGKLNDLNPSLPTADNPLAQVNTPGVGSITELENITRDVSGVTEATGQISGYSQEARQLAKGNLSEVNNLPETAETKVVEMSGVNDIGKQTENLDQYKDLAAQAKDPEALKEQVVQHAQQAAINHFSGKEQQLQEAMETVAKYKKQYASVPDISKLPRKRPNEMKDKPFPERLVQGIALQVQTEGENVMVDFNPYVGFRFTGRITGGLGWNQRVAYNTKQRYFSSKAAIYGPRAFGEYDLWKGFCPRAEVEVMNAFVPPFAKPGTLDVGKRQWVWGVFVGLKKDYRFIGGVRGTAMLMTRLFDPKHKSPYGDVINARFGFEFPVRKRVKPANN